MRAHERELKQAGIRRLSLFGTTASGNRRSDSGIDLLAAFDETRRISLLDVVRIELQLSELPGQRVELLEEGTLKPRVRKSVDCRKEARWRGRRTPPRDSLAEVRGLGNFLRHRRRSPLVAA